MPQPEKHNLIEDELMIKTKTTADMFFKEGNFGELNSLYDFYYYTAKWQKTNVIKATTKYAAEGLGKGWSEKDVRRVKKQLIKMGLIEDIVYKDKKGKIVYHFIKMNYIFKSQTHPSQKPQCGESTSVENPEGGFDHSVENGQSNALSTNTTNASKTDNELSSIEDSTLPKIKKKVYGDPDINRLYKEGLLILEIPKYDGSIKDNRRYAGMAIRKFKAQGGVDAVLNIFKASKESTFWNGKVTSFQDVLKYGVKIIASYRSEHEEGGWAHYG